MSGKPGVFALPSPTHNLIVEKEGTIGRVIFNKAVRLNAVSFDMWQAIPQIMSTLDSDQDVRVIILQGSGHKAFISGADISQFEDARSNAEQEHAYGEAMDKAFKALERISKPTIAMIRGVCIGGGLAIATTCDLRYAGEGATFGIPAARLGLAYPPQAALRLMNIVGMAAAKEIFFTARIFSTEEALAMRLLNRVYPAGDLELYVRDICKTISQNAPLTVKTAKISIDTLATKVNDDVSRELQQLVDLCSNSEDYTEGRKAFMEKRRPVFRGV
jgi:enoyl-CoA hydratase/carnithine racemase